MISYLSFRDEFTKIAQGGVEPAPEVKRPVKTAKADRGLCPGDIHDAADAKGVKWDDDPKFMELCAKLTGAYFLDGMDQRQLRIMYDHLNKKERQS